MLEKNPIANLDELLPHYRQKPEVQQSVAHNVGIWATVNGALALTRVYPMAFDPRKDYWFQTERRILVAYFAHRLQKRYRPADALRHVATATFHHFDTARADGLLGPVTLVGRLEGGWPRFAQLLAPVVATLPSAPDYPRLRAQWPTLPADGLQADLKQFITDHADPEASKMEPIFTSRLPWFPYLGLTGLENLRPRQKFFAGFYLVFASTNAYRVGGAMAFAPVLQNNPVQELLGYVEKWADGTSPDVTRFVVNGRDERDDKSHYTPVVELFGMLNLHRQPFYNGAAEKWYADFAHADDRSALQQMERLGRRTTAFLGERADLVAEYARMFRELVGQASVVPSITMEGIRGKSPSEADLREQVDAEIASEVQAAASARARQLTDPEAAAVLLHLLLDATLYQARVPLPTGGGPSAEPVAPPPDAAPPPSQPPDRTVTLPPPLFPIAQEALRYLGAGYHVLLAGAPGTGKTTLAQFVGAAWNQGLAAVGTTLILGEAPLTTVANSSWSPFHTIGGIVPDEHGHYTVQKGIFIDPARADGGDWYLRPECIVLDEMNRADLDRCIGELYPLLTRNVDWVAPAGIPGVRRISLAERFRIIATVNDATLDDVVFPISEGLARRFVRIEMRGALLDEIVDFIGSVDHARSEAARHVLGRFYAACESEDKVAEAATGSRLPFGVGYFGLLRSWVAGDLGLPRELAELALQEQAAHLLRVSLAPLSRDRGFAQIMAALQP